VAEGVRTRASHLVFQMKSDSHLPPRFVTSPDPMPAKGLYTGAAHEYTVKLVMAQPSVLVLLVACRRLHMHRSGIRQIQWPRQSYDSITIRFMHRYHSHAGC
jgi:hypothetical protein